MKSKYFIVDVVDFDQYKTYVKSDLVGSRKNNAGDKCVIKLPVNQVRTPKLFKTLTSYSQAEIVKVLRTEDWTPALI